MENEDHDRSKDEFIVLKFTQKQYKELLIEAERRDYEDVKTFLQDMIISEFYLTLDE